MSVMSQKGNVPIIQNVCLKKVTDIVNVETALNSMASNAKVRYK